MTEADAKRLAEIRRRLPTARGTGYSALGISGATFLLRLLDEAITERDFFISRLREPDEALLDELTEGVDPMFRDRDKEICASILKRAHERPDRATGRRDVMDDLIARLEAASEGSRELDVAIWVAIEGRGQPLVTVGPPTYASPRYFCNPDPAINWIGYDLLGITKHYTTSLDAAMTLVPEGFCMLTMSRSFNAPPKRQYCHATLECDAHSLGRDMRPDEEHEIEHNNASTLELAVCIVALKGHQMSTAEGERDG